MRITNQREKTAPHEDGSNGESELQREYAWVFDRTHAKISVPSAGPLVGGAVAAA